MIKTKLKESELGWSTIIFALLYAVGVVLSFSDTRDIYLSFSVGSGFVDSLLLFSIVIKNWLWLAGGIGLIGTGLGCKYQLDKELAIYKAIYLVLFIIAIVGYVSSVII